MKKVQEAGQLEAAPDSLAGYPVPGTQTSSAQQSVVDRRLRVQQQCHHVTNLLLSEDAAMAKPWHARAGVVGLGIPQLAPGVLDDGLARLGSRIGHTAQLAVV